MLQYLAWIGIYVISIKFMTKNAGRNSPIWGAFFVLLSLPMMSIAGIFIMIISPVFTFIVSNKLIASVFVMIFSFIFTVSIAFLVSKILKKKDLSKRKKETSLNYKWTAVIIGIIGFIMLFLLYLMTNKFDSWLMALIFTAIIQAWQMDARTKIEKNIKVKELKNKKYILFLRDFDSEINIKKDVSKVNKIYSWAEKGDIDKHVKELIPINYSFISFGNPEDYLPDFGSIKIYTDNESWKNIIIDYISNADKILILEGLSNGLLWELEYIKNNISPLKVLIMTYPQAYRDSKSYKNYMDYMNFIKHLYSLGYILPNIDVGADVVMSFDKNWNAKIEGQGIKFLSEYFKNLERKKL